MPRSDATDDAEDDLPAGWYRQQSDPAMLRWWDGDAWTDDLLAAPEAMVEEPRPPASADVDPPGQADRRAPSDVQDELGPSDGPATPPRADRPGRARLRAEPVSADHLAQAMADAATPAGERRPGPRPAPGPARRPSTDRPSSGAPGATHASSRGSAQRATRPTERPERSGRARPPAARHAPQKASSHVGRLGFRIGMAAAVALLAYLLVKPFLEEAPNARTLSAEPEPTTTTIAGGALAGEDGGGTAPGPVISDGLLRLADLPRGWSALAQASQPPAGFCGGRNPLSVIVPTEQLGATFTNTTDGRYLVNLALRFDSDDEAGALLDLVARTINACRTYDVDGVGITIEPLTFPRLGDDTYTVHYSGTSELGPIAGDVVWFRKGDTVINVQSFAFGTFDLELVEFLAEGLERRL